MDSFRVKARPATAPSILWSYFARWAARFWHARYSTGFTESSIANLHVRQFAFCFACAVSAGR